MLKKEDLISFFLVSLTPKGGAGRIEPTKFPKFVRTSWLPIGVSWPALWRCAQTATAPRVHRGTQGTGARIVNPANDQNGFTAFFQVGNGAIAVLAVLAGLLVPITLVRGQQAGAALPDLA